MRLGSGVSWCGVRASDVVGGSGSARGVLEKREREERLFYWFVYVSMSLAEDDCRTPFFLKEVVSCQNVR